MDICRTVSEIREITAGFRQAGERIGLVTTMGALHAGHMSLIAEAQATCDRVIATIFVNPSQFGDPSDLAQYPRNDARDIEMLCEAGVDALLLPDVETIYPPGDETVVDVTRLSNILHGKIRPGHFKGVSTVVARLFNICQPDIAFFGEKDYQQLQVIKRMVRDLHMPVEVRGVATVREPDGLALSSRNVRLTPKDRAAAVVLSQALDAAEARADQGVTIHELDQIVRSTVNSEPRATLRAVDIVATQTLEPVSGQMTTPIAIMLSAEFGGILLIDQREIAP